MWAKPLHHPIPAELGSASPSALQLPPNTPYDAPDPIPGVPRNIADLLPFMPIGISQASPLSAYLRVPLQYYYSIAVPFFPDETNSLIHKVYTSPHEVHTMRHFCGFCGTPLSYWSEEPRSEADFIQLTLGSLNSEDLADLEEMGLLPELESDEEAEVVVPRRESASAALVSRAQPDTEMLGTDERVVAVRGRETVGAVPWFDTLVEGSRLGNLRTTKGHGQSRDGSVRVEWEVVEWTEGDDGSPPEMARNGKRKLGDRDSVAETGAMEGIQQ